MGDADEIEDKNVIRMPEAANTGLYRQAEGKMA